MFAAFGNYSGGGWCVGGGCFSGIEVCTGMDSWGGVSAIGEGVEGKDDEIRRGAICFLKEKYSGG